MPLNIEREVATKAVFPETVIYNRQVVELLPMGAHSILNQLQGYLLTTYGAPASVTAILDLPTAPDNPIVWAVSTHEGSAVPRKGKLGVSSLDRRTELVTCAKTLTLLVRYLYSGEDVTLPNSVEFAGRKWYIVEAALKRLQTRNRDTLGKLYGFKPYDNIRVANQTVVHGDYGSPVDKNSHIIDTWAISNYHNLLDAESALILAKLEE